MANVYSQQTGRRSKGAAPENLVVEQETVTPAMAHEWLGQNTHNRSLSKVRVARYARDMASGAFTFTGDPIRFNGDGQLIDGQHRLHACIEADRPFDTLVIRGMALDVQEKLDQGAVRRAGDHLTLRGYDAGTSLAATARQLIGIKAGHASTFMSKGRPTNAELLAVVDKHPKLADSVEAVEKKIIYLPPSLLAAMHYIGANVLKDRESAESFVSVFTNGAPTYGGDAAHAWRERLVAIYEKQADVRPGYKLIGTIHAWNLHRRREPLQMFRIPDAATIEGLDADRI